MDALGIALIVIGLAIVCSGLVFPRGFSEKPNEESTAIAEFERSQAGGSREIPQGESAGAPQQHVGDPFESRLLEDLNAMDPEVRNERGEGHKPDDGATDRSVLALNCLKQLAPCDPTTVVASGFAFGFQWIKCLVHLRPEAGDVAG
jgi:hypothetical protein